MLIRAVLELNPVIDYYLSDMFLNKLLLFLLFTGFGHLYAQTDFCDAVMAITRDAPNQFRNIRGNLKESHANASIWHTGIKVPGSIGARFVASMGLFYECAFFQTRNKNEVGEVYHKYKSLLSECLGQHGFTLSEQPNFYPGMGDFKKLVYMQEMKEDTKADKAPAHITLEATYNKDVGQYTIVMFIFEH